MAYNIDSLVVRFDNREGFHLVDYEIVGLPVWKLGLAVQTLDEVALSVTEEFVIKLVGNGIVKTSDISRILGLDEKIVLGAVSDLVRSDLVANRYGMPLALTKKGTSTLTSCSVARPIDHQVWITYDALTKKPQWFENYQLFQTKEMKEEGIRTVTASPNTRPLPSDLPLDDVESVIRKRLKGNSLAKLLRIKDVLGRRIMYQKSVLLVYKAERGTEVQVGFAIDKRMSEAHELAFARIDGPRKLRIEECLSSYCGESPSTLAFGKKVGKEIEKKADDSLDETRFAAKRLADVNGQIDDIVVSVDGKEIDQGAVGKLISEKEELERKLRENEVRMVSVYEHPDLLLNALRTAKERIVIVSPWITRTVVDARFLMALRERLVEGVEVLIGYGLDERDDERPLKTSAEQELIDLSGMYERFWVKRLGDTHAKILIKDGEFMVATSFNWLSFKGNPNRRFREEWGTYVSIPELIEKQYVALRKRIVGKLVG